MEEVPLGNIIITVIIAVLLLGALTMAIAGVKKIEDREKCKLTAWAQANTQYQPGVAGVVPGPKFDLGLRQDCPTYEIEFLRDKATERVATKDDIVTMDIYDNTKKKPVSSYKKLTPEMVNDVVADQMRECYYQFWEGKVPVFFNKYVDANWGWNPTQLNGNNVRCYPCAELHIDAAVEYPPTGYAGNASLWYYITEKKGQDMNQTYFEYLNGYNGYCQLTTGKQGSCLKEELDDMDIQKDLVLQKGKFYEVLLIRRGEERADYTITSYVVPSDQEGKLCSEGMVA